MAKSIDASKEKKLGRTILETLTEISQTPHENVRRYFVLERNLKRAVKAYRELTGSDYLLGKSPAHYGLETVMGKTELELMKQTNTRRDGNESE